MRLILKILLACLMAAAAFCSCRRAQDEPQTPAVYYWRTVLKLSPAERQALADLKVRRVYLHLFDVVREGGELRPEATLRFADTIPAGIEVVPVVFIDEGALRQAEGTDSLGAMIVRRADAMLAAYGYPRAEELQLDYDWSASTRDTFFGILRQARAIMHERGGRLSSTVRLHQLAETPPPADSGVLMVYNTGDFRSPDETNSILTLESVTPYLRHLRGYGLPLSTALPVYGWNLVYRAGEFVMIAPELPLDDSTLFEPLGDGRFRCLTYTGVSAGSERRLFPGDIVRHEQPDAPVLESVQRAIADERPVAASNIILYHLDENSLKEYDTTLLQKLFSRN